MFAYKDCYASLENGCLRIGNSLLERVWRVTGGTLRGGALTDKTCGCDAAQEAEGPWKLPFGNFDACSLQAGSDDCGGLSEPYLSAALVMENDAAVQTLRFEIFPRTPFLMTRLSVCPKKEVVPESLGREDILEQLCLPSVHCAVTAVELFDKSDYCDTLIRTSKDSPYPTRACGYRGDIFLLESQVGKTALLIAKYAPVAASHLLRPEKDLTVTRGTVTLRGSGVDYDALVPGEETEFYGVTLGTGTAGTLLRQYRRLLCLRRKGEGRLLAMANTWGDRNCEKSLCEAFMAAEFRTAQRIGADGVTMDDGWEKGAIRDPDKYMQHIWEGYHDAAADYWSVNETRFPRGLSPVVQEAERCGVWLGLWFSPDSSDDFAHWREDAALLTGLRDAYGIRYFKLDGIKVRSKKGDRNLTRLLDTLCRAGCRLQLDTTGGLDDRFGYQYKTQYGILFVENRYTDFGSYYPYRTLRNLWTLSHALPARSMQFEVLNPRRNRDRYGDDPFAPDRYDMDYLFASVMVANPLLWCELSRLEEPDAAALARILHIWKPCAEELYRSEVLPIGEEPCGRSLTGFAALCGETRGYLVLLREDTEREAASYRIPDLAGRTLDTQLLASNGQGGVDPAVSPDGTLTARFSRKNQYLFLRYTVRA